MTTKPSSLAQLLGLSHACILQSLAITDHGSPMVGAFRPSIATGLTARGLNNQ
ncbi:hypothetical protein MHH60_23150 [Paenibacillus sp. FSL H7-0716]|uniref:hypothetical protein n=1 Tax=Paenibacillus TaxID=44249 RepID=UPI0015C3CE36|nr:hypothetical protein [Paenibacillus odorifer]